MTNEIALEFITGIFRLYIGLIPVLLVSLMIFKLLRYASGWQPKQHTHKIFDVG